MQNNILELFYKNRKSCLIESEFGDRFYYHDILSFLKDKNIAMLSRKLVFAIIDNNLGGIFNYISLLAVGAVPMVISPKVTKISINNLILNYRPRYILVDHSNATNFYHAKTIVNKLGYVILDLGPSFGLDQIHDDLALLVSTSGSTGSEKYVRLSHSNIWTNARAIAEYLRLDNSERPITVLPPSYSYGLSVIHSHIFVGASLGVIQRSLFEKEFWSFFHEIKASSFAGVPYHYQILKKLRFTDMKLPHLRTLTQAGGHMSKELVLDFANYCNHNDIQFFVMYGQTEASPRMSYVPSEHVLAKADTIGLPISGGEFELRSESGELIKGPGSIGELIYKGPNVCLGYAETAADLSCGDVNFGVLHTGDIAESDEDGYYRIIGRKKRFIKLFGNRINLQDVEKLLANIENEIVCAGKDDLLEVYLVGPIPNAERGVLVKQTVINNLRIAPQGVMVYQIVALPRNESGKVRYADLHPEKAQRLA